MTKTELIDLLTQTMKVHHDRAVNKADAAAFLDSLSIITTTTLEAGGEVPLPGLGKLSVSARAAREGRNPRTGETIQIAASRKLKFAPTKALKDAVKG